MKTPILFLFSLINAFAFGQANDSTSNFNFFPLETVRQTLSYNDQHFEGSCERSSLLIFDKQYRHCFITVKLNEYKAGKQVSSDTIFFKDLIDGNNTLSPFEDSSMLFSLYRTHYKDSTYFWGFKTPNLLKTKSIRLLEPEYRYQVVAIPQNYANNKIAIGKSFPLLVITSPDKSNNLPFFKQENLNDRYPNTWNEPYKLGHTFIVELLIEPTPIKKPERENSKSNTL